MVKPSIGVEYIIALTVAVVSIIIAVGMVTKQVPVSEGTQTLSALIGGGILVHLVLLKNRSER